MLNISRPIWLLIEAQCQHNTVQVRYFVQSPQLKFPRIQIIYVTYIYIYIYIYTNIYIYAYIYIKRPIAACYTSFPTAQQLSQVSQV